MSQYPVSIVCSLHEPPYTQVKGSGSLGTLDWLSQRLTPLTAPLLPPLPFPRVLLRTCVAEYTHLHAPCVRTKCVAGATSYLSTVTLVCVSYRLRWLVSCVSSSVPMGYLRALAYRVLCCSRRPTATCFMLCCLLLCPVRFCMLVRCYRYVCDCVLFRRLRRSSTLLPRSS
jgi:hypothetical protein